jgi:hypothetical protein
MQFSGPDKVDLADLNEINLGFLELLGTESGGTMIPSDVPQPIAGRLRSLSVEERRRLARSPFLLCSCHEDDIEYWRNILQPGASGDLFTPGAEQAAGVLRLTSGVISFTWQLARKNAFVARLLTGASSAWCEEIAMHPLLRLIDGGSRRGDAIQLRLAHEDRFWERLLLNALSNDPLIRRAARAGGLQRMLLSSGAPTRLLLAAKSSTPPRQRRLPP